MLDTNPGADQVGYVALAAVEVLIGILIDQNVLAASDHARIRALVIDRLTKHGTSISKAAAKLLGGGKP